MTSDIYSRMSPRAILISVAISVAAAACGALAPVASSSPPAISAMPAEQRSPTEPLTSTQRHWVDSSLAALSLHDRVGQMVMIWMLGDYSNARDSSYAEVIRRV